MIWQSCWKSLSYRKQHTTIIAKSKSQRISMPGSRQKYSLYSTRIKEDMVIVVLQMNFEIADLG